MLKLLDTVILATKMVERSYYIDKKLKGITYDLDRKVF